MKYRSISLKFFLAFFLRHLRQNLIIFGAIFFVQGCTEVKKTLGIERSVPQEFDVIENTPLIVPPHTDLPLPIDNVSIPFDTSAAQAAEAALIGSPPSVESNQRAISETKQLIDQEARQQIFKDERPEWMQKLFFWQKKKSGEVLNPEEEAAKKNSTVFPNDMTSSEAFLINPETIESIPASSVEKITTSKGIQKNAEKLSLVNHIPIPGASIKVQPPRIIAKSAQELYDTSNAPRLTKSAQKESVASTKIMVPILLTNTLPSKKVIAKYSHKPKLKLSRASVSKRSDDLTLSQKNDAQKAVNVTETAQKTSAPTIEMNPSAILSELAAKDGAVQNAPLADIDVVVENTPPNQNIGTTVNAKIETENSELNTSGADTSGADTSGADTSGADTSGNVSVFPKQENTSAEMAPVSVRLPEPKEENK